MDNDLSPVSLNKTTALNATLMPSTGSKPALLLMLLLYPLLLFLLYNGDCFCSHLLTICFHLLAIYLCKLDLTLGFKVNFIFRHVLTSYSFFFFFFLQYSFYWHISRSKLVSELRHVGLSLHKDRRELAENSNRSSYISFQVLKKRRDWNKEDEREAMDCRV